MWQQSMGRWHLDLTESRDRWRCWRGQMTSLKSDVVQLGAQVQHHDQRMSEFERQLKDITPGRSTGSGAASSAASSEPHSEPARGSGTMHHPKNQRTVLACSKPAKAFAKFLRDLGKDHCWSIVCMQEFNSSNGKLARPRDTGCLQRLHAQGSGAWRSWSQLRSRHVS